MGTKELVEELEQLTENFTKREVEINCYSSKDKMIVYRLLRFFYKDIECSDVSVDGQKIYRLSAYHKRSVIYNRNKL